MYNSLDISVSGMVAQRTRLNTIAANLANQNTILDANGEPNPYQRRFAVFAPGDDSGGMGVRVRSIEVHDGPPKLKWDPSSPYARQPGTPDAGYVYTPNIDPITEQIDAMEAQRAYEANVQAAEAAKSMMAQALSLIA